MVYKRLLKPNGKIEQWGVLNTTIQQPTIIFNIKYSESPTIECVGKTTGPEGAARHVFSIYSIDIEKFSVYGNYSLLSGFHWTAKGY